MGLLDNPLAFEEDSDAFPIGEDMGEEAASRSVSMGVPWSLIVDSLDSLLISSGGRFRGCVSGSWVRELPREKRPGFGGLEDDGLRSRFKSLEERPADFLSGDEGGVDDCGGSDGIETLFAFFF
jgi:hypothetical protein